MTTQRARGIVSHKNGQDLEYRIRLTQDGLSVRRKWARKPVEIPIAQLVAVGAVTSERLSATFRAVERGVEIERAAGNGIVSWDQIIDLLNGQKEFHFNGSR